MIRKSNSAPTEVSIPQASQPRRLALVRFGAISQVVRAEFPAELPITREERIVVKSERGLELAVVLEEIRELPGSETTALEVLRIATREEQQQYLERQQLAQTSFAEWCKRFERWNLTLQLIDIEQTFDEEKTILYVLSDRNSESTMLALYAAAEGLGTVEVTPVGADGIMAVAQQSEGGCGCGSGGGGCSS